MIEMLFRDPHCFQSFQNPKWKYLALVKGMIFQCHSFRYGGLVLVLKKALWKKTYPNLKFQAAWNYGKEWLCIVIPLLEIISLYAFASHLFLGEVD